MLIINKGLELPQKTDSSAVTLASGLWELPAHLCGPVAYAATPLSKEHVLRQLVATLAGRVFHALGPWQELPLQLTQGVLGEPLVMCDALPVLSVSFSQADGKTWGALTCAGRIGIDVAFAPEFPPNYPLWRVFSKEEFDRTGALVGGNLSQTAALLWSVKEAAVKALGVGFNYLAPREITILSGKPKLDGYLFEVDVGHVVKTWARPEGKGWLALGLVQ